jgi:hypothetical protein
MNGAGVHGDARVVDPPTPVQLSASENSNRSISAGSAMRATTLTAAHASLHADSVFHAPAGRVGPTSMQASTPARVKAPGTTPVSWRPSNEGAG